MRYEALLCPECGKADLVIVDPKTMDCPVCRASWGIIHDPNNGKLYWGRHPNRTPVTIVGELADKEIEQ